jgi:Concanavalin A-like lectin/glucanases superfamily
LEQVQRLLIVPAAALALLCSPSLVAAAGAPNIPGSTARHSAPAHSRNYAKTILADHPSAYWRLDDPVPPACDPASGNCTAGDLTGHSHTGNFDYGVATVKGVTNDGDAAMSFDGSQGYVAVSNVPSPALTSARGPWTLDVWAKPASASPTQPGSMLYVGTDGTGMGIVSGDCAGNAGNQVCVRFGSVAWIAGKARLSTTAYTNIVVTYNGAGHEAIYVNGARTATASFTPDELAPGASNAVTIGAEYYPPDQQPFHYFHGAIDEASVFSVALTAAQVRAQYHAAH